MLILSWPAAWGDQRLALMDKRGMWLFEGMTDIVGCVMQKGPKSRCHTKGRMAVTILLLVWHRLLVIFIFEFLDLFFFSLKVGVIPKEGWVRPCSAVLLLVWQQLKPSWTFLHDTAHCLDSLEAGERCLLLWSLYTAEHHLEDMASSLSCSSCKV